MIVIAESPSRSDRQLLKSGILMLAEAHGRDRWRDMDAGRQPVVLPFVNRGYAEKQPTGHHFETRSLVEASDLIIEMLEIQGNENWNRKK